MSGSTRGAGVDSATAWWESPPCFSRRPDAARASREPMSSSMPGTVTTSSWWPRKGARTSIPDGFTTSPRTRTSTPRSAPSTSTAEPGSFGPVTLTTRGSGSSSTRTTTTAMRATRQRRAGRSRWWSSSRSRWRGGGLLGLGDRPGGVDQPDVAEGLGIIAQHLPRLRVDLLGEQSDVVGVGDRLLELPPGTIELARRGERLSQPEGADEEAALLTLQAVVRAVAVDQATAVGEPCIDGVDRGTDPGIGARQKADDGEHQGRSVQLIGAERLRERSGRFAPALGQDGLPNAAPGLLPAGDAVGRPKRLRELDRAVDGDPAHQLRVEEVARCAT